MVMMNSIHSIKILVKRKWFVWWYSSQHTPISCIRRSSFYFLVSLFSSLAIHVFNINSNRHLLVLILLVIFFLKYENDNDAISDFHLVGGVVCDATNKRTRDIADNIKQMLIRRKKTRKRRRRRREEKRKKKKKEKIEFRTCRRKGKKQ